MWALLGTRLYPENEGPLYSKGMAICAGFMALAGLLALCLRWNLKRENRRLIQVRALEDGEEDVELLAEVQERKSATTFTYLL